MEEFLEAIVDEDLEKVRTMVQYINVNDNSEGVTALELATQCGNTEPVRILLEHGSKVNSKDLVNPILYSKNRDIVRHLLSKGADPYSLFDYYADKNTNALVKAVKATSDQNEKRDHEGRATPREIVRILLDHDNGIGDPEVKGPYGLYAAVALGDMDLVKMYFSDGVRIERCYELGLNLLLEACRNENLELASLLIEHGANPNETDKPFMPYETPLAIAMENENTELVRLLLGKGADDAGMPIYCESTMHQTDDRLTGLMYACAWGQLDMVKEVLAHGRDVNAENTEGRSALYYCNDAFKCWTFCPRADHETNLAIIWELLKAGARCTIDCPWDVDTTILSEFLSDVIIQNDYHTTNLSGITAPALMLKACGSSTESLHPFIRTMDLYLQAPDEKREKIFKHENSFDNFNSLFQLVILCGNKPTREFVNKYSEVVLKGTGKVDGVNWLKDIANSGYSLKEMSRVKLREIIPRPLVTNAMSDTIPLPPLLKKYILFDEILPFCT